ncbi:MAG: DUF945 family protein [Gammaproteobacteria bacterium]|nr:DUF945 family protein [Gammaproteobacteria bacterium]
MKKSVIAIAVPVVAAALIVLPAGYFGQVTETTLKNRMANMPYGFQMELKDYRRGWFSSTARLEWEPLGGLLMPGLGPRSPLPDAALTDLPSAIDMLVSGPIAMEIEIAHGPVFFAVEPGAGLFHARGRVDLGNRATDGEEDPADNYMEFYVSSFSGATVDNRLVIPAAEAEFGPMAVNLAGALLEGEWTGPESFQLQHVALDTMEMSIGVAGTGVRIAISDLESSTEFPQGLEGGAILAPSQATSFLGEILVESSEGDTVFRMTGLSSEDATSPEEDGTYRADSDATIESLEVLGREFAPIEIRQTVGGLSEESLLKLLSALSGGIVEPPAAPQEPEENPQGPSATPPSLQVAAGMSQFSRDMQEAILAMLADGPYAEISAGLTYQGEHELRSDLHYAFDSELAPATVEELSLLGVLSGLEFTMDAEIAIPAAEELFGQGIIQLGLMQGLFQPTETTYTVSVALGNGVLSINGRLVPIPLGPPAAPGAVPPPG